MIITARSIILTALFSLLAWCAQAQSLTGSDPDSLLAEWLETGEWEAVSLHPDIAMDWLTDADSSALVRPDNRRQGNCLININIPVGAALSDWAGDSGEIVSPVSMKYRVRVSEPLRWEFRLQTNLKAGDTCFLLPANGMPKKVSTGFLIRPGQLIREVIFGDFQVNCGFGAVAGSSPVFSVSLGNPGSLCRSGRGIRLHSGTVDGRFFRGIASNMVMGRSTLILFGSGRERIHEEVAGFGWKTGLTNSELGITGIRVNNQYPPEIKEGWNAAWQPDSGRYSRIGIWAQTRVPFGIIFGEAGWSPSHGFGWIAGIRIFEVRGFSAVLRYSGCSPGYPVAYSLFQSGSGMTREGQRVITSFRYSSSRQFTWLGSVEVNLTKWPVSSEGGLKSTSRICSQWKYLSKSQWSATGTIQLGFPETEVALPEKLTWKLAFDLGPELSGILRLKAGITQQLQGFGGIPGKGTTADCSLSVLLLGKKLMISGGFRLFSVEKGIDPVYAYEPDVRFGWSAPVLSGSGTRWYGVLRWKLTGDIETEVKVCQNAYYDLVHFTAENPGGVSGKVQVVWKMVR